MGCGACQWACPSGAVSLCDIADKGIRPFVDETKCQKCGKCIEVCPGIKLEHGEFPKCCMKELSAGWGPVLAMYEGYAIDQEIRFKGSSGGAATAIALWALERGNFAGVLHIKADPNDPLHNIPTFSRNRIDLMQTVGSRYAPAAPCQSFDLIKEADGQCVFVGKPCDCAALRKACQVDAGLAAKVGLVISIFCAGTPTTAGTLAILRLMKIENSAYVTSFRYRGHGWPGDTMAEVGERKPGGNNPLLGSNNDILDGQDTGCWQRSLSYAEAWGGILSKNGQLRCRLCPDKTGEFSDISLGDPWYRDIQGDIGRSLILIRTSGGEKIWRILQNQGYLEMQPSIWSRLPESQDSIYQGRCSLLGRLLIMRLWKIPIAVFVGFNLEFNWKQLDLMQKIKTVLGTVRRILQRHWFSPEV